LARDVVAGVTVFPVGLALRAASGARAVLGVAVGEGARSGGGSEAGVAVILGGVVDPAAALDGSLAGTARSASTRPSSGGMGALRESGVIGVTLSL
jgi:hypothetical protein